jgi:ATP-dependent DNA ligase
LIELDGSDLRNLPIETRKATLASLLRKPGPLRLSEHIAADGLRVFAHACRLGAEGIVSKRLGSNSNQPSDGTGQRGSGHLAAFSVCLAHVSLLRV